MSQTYDLDNFPHPDATIISNRKKVLVVDDDALQLEVLEYRLNQLGFDVIKLTEGQTVIQTAKNLRPDLILLDIQLPDSDGLDLCQRLSDQASTSEIPVIILSGCDRNDVVRAARSSGSRFFLRKPYDPNALQLIIEHTINESGNWC